MFISTVNPNIQYEVVDTIFVLHGAEAGGFMGGDGIDIDTAFEEVKLLLSEKAAAMGANAVIGCDFEQRIAVSSGGWTDKQVLEIFAFGTAVILSE